MRRNEAAPRLLIGQGPQWIDSSLLEAINTSDGLLDSPDELGRRPVTSTIWWVLMPEGIIAFSASANAEGMHRRAGTARIVTISNLKWQASKI